MSRRTGWMVVAAIVGLQIGRVASVVGQEPTLIASRTASASGPSWSRPPLAKVSPKDETRVYLDKLSGLLDQLRREPNRADVRTNGLYASWYEQYSRKIANLPTAGVDQEVVALGMQTSSKLREASEAIKSGMGRARVAELSVPEQTDYYYQDVVYGYARQYGGTYGGYYGNSGYGYGYVPHGYGSYVAPVGERYWTAVRNTQREHRLKTLGRTQEKNSAMREARQLIDEIENSVAQARSQWKG